MNKYSNLKIGAKVKFGITKSKRKNAKVYVGYGEVKCGMDYEVAKRVYILLLTRDFQFGRGKNNLIQKGFHFTVFQDEIIK